MTEHLSQPETSVRLPIRVRPKAEQDAFMAGQRSALKLAREKGLGYAEHIIGLSHAGIAELEPREDVVSDDR